MEKPRSLGTTRFVSLKDKLIPWRAGEPAMLNMQGMPSDHLYIALFTEEERLKDFLKLAQVAYDSIKKVTDGHEFLGSIPYLAGGRFVLHVILDPYQATNGKLRWCEVFRS